MATKRCRGGTWHFTVRRAGVLPKPLYLSFPTEAEGDEYVARLEALLDRGVVPEEFKQTRHARRDLRSNIRAYIDAQPITGDDKKLLAVIQERLPKDFDLSQVTFAWATAWVTTLKRQQNLSPSTVRKHVGALSRCLSWLAASGSIPVNPLKLLPKGYASYTDADTAAVTAAGGTLKEDEERDRRLEKGEEKAIRAILAGAKPKGRQRALELREADSLVLLFDMALETAMRMREMFTLERGQVDLRRHTIFLDKTKNGDRRQVPITTVLAALLKPHMKRGDPKTLLFPWWDGHRSPKALARVTSQLSRQYDRIFDAAGAADLHFHDLRHEATSRIYERTNLSDLEVAKITGHRDLRTLKRYANLRASTLAKRLW